MVAVDGTLGRIVRPSDTNNIHSTWRQNTLSSNQTMNRLNQGSNMPVIAMDSDLLTINT